MAARSEKPVPAADELSQPFWDAAIECRYYNHPPRLVCGRCSSQRLEFVPLSGRGTIYSFTVMHQPSVGGFEGEVPYVNIVVELEELPICRMRNSAKSESAAVSKSARSAAPTWCWPSSGQSGDVAGQGQDRDRRDRIFGIGAPVDTKQELSAIALDVGFSSQAHFTSRFRETTGETPLRFRLVACRSRSS